MTTANVWSVLQRVLVGAMLPQFFHQMNNALTTGVCHVQLSVDENDLTLLQPARESLQGLVAMIEPVQHYATLSVEKSDVFSPKDWSKKIAQLAVYLPSFLKAKIMINIEENPWAVHYHEGVYMTLILSLLASARGISSHPVRELTIRGSRFEKSGAEINLEGSFTCDLVGDHIFPARLLKDALCTLPQVKVIALQEGAGVQILLGGFI